ncbi:hypothetical protein [Paludifilum halophilum]|uniref:hypothetical protein n=1 Tax=Paludifilum halophilum TaxID=1642702 RepID=UPI0011401A64|nr:hypothetical protein [Paludifilum halophilum]
MKETDWNRSEAFLIRESYEFPWDERLQVHRPLLHVEYEEMPPEVQHTFELKCQEVCAQIPPQIKVFEQRYMDRFEALNQAREDEDFFGLMEEMNELSSCISDLNILFLHIEGHFIGASVHA